MFDISSFFILPSLQFNGQCFLLYHFICPESAGSLPDSPQNIFPPAFPQKKDPSRSYAPEAVSDCHNIRSDYKEYMAHPNVLTIL